MAPSEYSEGKRIRAFEFLSLHLPQIKNCKLSMMDSKGGAMAMIDLVQKGAGVAAAQQRLFTCGQSAQQPPSVDGEIKEALDELAKMAEMMGQVLGERLTPPDSEYIFLLAMSKCLDFTKMISDGAAAYCAPERAKPQLRRLYNWLQSRLDDEDDEEDTVPFEDMPPFEPVWQQFEELAKRLQEASKEAAYQKWKGASGTVIMKHVFTEPRFYSKCEDYLYLWLHMATKSMCEAVVEGMGGVWDRSDRQGNWVTATKEAVIAWNTPKPYHPVATAFIARSLDHWSGGVGKWHDRFTHHDMHHQERELSKGVVMERKKREAMQSIRLPASFYDVSVL